MTTEPLIVLVMDDEYARYFDQPAQGSVKSPAVQWLEASFSCRWSLGGILGDQDEMDGPDCIRPMIELIDQADDDDYDNAMIVTRTDYDDPGRWWL